MSVSDASTSGYHVIPKASLAYVRNAKVPIGTDRAKKEQRSKANSRFLAS